jgi:hypothetical protein
MPTITNRMQDTIKCECATAHRIGERVLQVVCSVNRGFHGWPLSLPVGAEMVCVAVLIYIYNHDYTLSIKINKNNWNNYN